MLKHLWGTVIPALVAFGTTNSGSVVFIATQFIPSRTLGQTAIAPEHAEAAMTALASVHQAGLLHDDVRASNFLVPTIHPGSKVMLVDFGFASFSDGRRSEKSERAKLQTLLGPNMLPRKTIDA